MSLCACSGATTSKLLNSHNARCLSDRLNHKARPSIRAEEPRNAYNNKQNDDVFLNLSSGSFLPDRVSQNLFQGAVAGRVPCRTSDIVIHSISRGAVSFRVGRES